ncbi:MAG: hypothetical protein OYL92_10525, partial [Acidobacteriota bacterium]|nr:hypothetical protein [Acidobacteriota bacterium]MDE3265392.1 hypothetical protein [Acidobacteriota bacterium]
MRRVAADRRPGRAADVLQIGPLPEGQQDAASGMEAAPGLEDGGVRRVDGHSDGGQGRSPDLMGQASLDTTWCYDRRGE